MDDRFEAETTGSSADAATLLRSLADGLDAGSVRLGVADDAVDVAIPEEVAVEVELETEDEDRLALVVELEWTVVPSELPQQPAEASTETTDRSIEPPEASAHAEGEVAESAEPTAGESKEATGGDAAGVVESTTDRTGTGPATDDPYASDDVEPTDEVVDGELLPVGPAAPLASLARFELFRDRAEEWRWRLVHRNGNVIATSGEGYTRRHDAEKGLRSVVRNAPDAVVVEDGEPS